MMISPFSCTSDEFAKQLFSHFGRGLQQAKALYTSFIREGSIQKDLPPFKNAPQLFLEMVSCVDTKILPHVVVGEEGGTVRFMLNIVDGHIIESVLMKMQHGYTLCVSSQIGCRMGCRFCCTGKSGFVRNLTCGEIVQQLFVARHMFQKDVKNVVFMGMGEFFDNKEAGFHAVDIFSDPYGFNIGMKHITISTSGDIQGILSLAERKGATPNLAVSLNTPFDDTRKYLMPYRKEESLEALRDALKIYCAAKKREVLISYVLLKGINDSHEDAECLSAFLEDLPVKINIIPFNEFPGASFASPKEEAIMFFLDFLRKKGFRTLLRGKKGGSIQAACGQLQKK